MLKWCISQEARMGRFAIRLRHFSCSCLADSGCRFPINCSSTEIFCHLSWTILVLAKAEKPMYKCILYVAFKANIAMTMMMYLYDCLRSERSGNAVNNRIKFPCNKYVTAEQCASNFWPRFFNRIVKGMVMEYLVKGANKKFCQKSARGYNTKFGVGQQKFPISRKNTPAPLT